MLLQGKKGVIMGLAGSRSLAWHIGQGCIQNGSEVIFTCQNQAIMERNQQLIDENPNSSHMICDVSDDQQIANTFARIKDKFGSLDFLVHSIAYAPQESFNNDFLHTTRNGFLKALEVSCYSLTAVARQSYMIMNKGASILTLSYLGATNIVPGYNLMGVAKAALESSVRYLAHDLGKYDIRVNCLRLGPFKTIAARSIKNFNQMYTHHRNNNLAHRAMNVDDITGSAIFLLSNLSKGITSEIINTDLGYKNLVMGGEESL